MAHRNTHHLEQHHSGTLDVACFQHPNRQAEVILRFYDNGELVEFQLCSNCRHATAIACLQHEGLITPDYEVIDVEGGELI